MNDNERNMQIGLRIRAARKNKGLNQTEFSKLIEKAIRTVQKYESGEIEVSISMIYKIAEVLECDATYLLGYNIDSKPLASFSDILNFIMQMDNVEKLRFNIDVKRPPSYDGWLCSMNFNGKDKDSDLNQTLCQFLEDYHIKRSEYENYEISYENFEKWKNETLAYYSQLKIKSEEPEIISEEERKKRLLKLLKEQFESE